MRRLGGLGLCGLLMVPGAALADEKQDCAASYERAQEFRQASKLRQARVQLIQCAQAACPEFVRVDCGRWLGEVEESMPSVVFVARDAKGNDLTDVVVKIGDDVVADQLDGRATPVDPGAQTFTFEADGHDPIEKKLIVAQGEKNRAITVTFAGGGLEPATEPDGEGGAAEVDAGETLKKTPNRTLAYVLGGVGVLGIGGFALFGSAGKSQEADLRDSCAPNCADSKVDEVKTKYLFADISLGVGIVSLGVATYFFLSPPGGGDAPADSKAVRFDVAATPGGGFATVGGGF